MLRSRYVIGGAYALAVILTVTGVALASSPPKSGPISPASTAILIVLGFNLVLILAIATVVGLRLFEMIDARANDAGARLHLAGDCGQHGAVARGDALQQPQQVSLVHRAQHLAHPVRVQPAFTMRNGLVQQRQRVAHAPRSGARDQRQPPRGAVYGPW